MKELKSKLGKELSYYLRHNPGKLNLNMTNDGWVKIQEIIDNSNNRFSREIIKQIEETDSKKRYTISQDGEYIRANYGHSIPQIKVEYKEKTPPDKLYHGTCEKSAKLIQETGIKRMSRNYVHLSSDIETAKIVGLRHAHGENGRLVIYEIDTKRMSLDGYKFYLSESNTWLTDYVPTQYIVSLSCN